VKHFISVAAALSILAPFSIAAEVVSTKERAFVVRYTDNTTERYAVKWILDVAANTKEEGGSYVPYQGAVENRRCAWSVDASVERKVSLVTRLGEPIPVTGMSRSLAGGAGKEAVSGAQKGSCAGAKSESDAAIAEARRASLASFEKLAEDDFQELQTAARARAGVSQVTVQ